MRLEVELEFMLFSLVVELSYNKVLLLVDILLIISGYCQIIYYINQLFLGDRDPRPGDGQIEFDVVFDEGESQQPDAFTRSKNIVHSLRY